MAEPTTGVSYTVILREIGREMGWSRDSSDWSSDQLQDAADMIAAGCRTAYYPPQWEWRFLRINFSLDTVVNTREYDLPDDFASLLVTMTYTEDDGNATDIRIVSEQQIRARYQNQTTSSTGYPIEAAIRVERPTNSTSTRYVLAVWPEPDGVYTMEGQCVVQPNTVNGAGRYPYGNQSFHECLLNAILMQCERKLGENDGKYARAFAESLVSAKRIDDQTAPDTLGYNGDGSDGIMWSRRDVRPGRVYYGNYG